MNGTDDPLAYFITWTVYGTFLQGDSRWWRQRERGSQLPQPLLDQWHRNRLNHDVVLLDSEQREMVETAISRHVVHRNWRLWVANARSNHVHVVVTAPKYKGNKVRDQLKANCTRELRQQNDVFVGRPLWTVGGDWISLYCEEKLENAVVYVGESQDRKDLE